MAARPLQKRKSPESLVPSNSGQLVRPMGLEPTQKEPVEGSIRGKAARACVISCCIFLLEGVGLGALQKKSKKYAKIAQKA